MSPYQRNLTILLSIAVAVATPALIIGHLRDKQWVSESMQIEGRLKSAYDGVRTNEPGKESRAVFVDVETKQGLFKIEANESAKGIPLGTPLRMRVNPNDIYIEGLHDPDGTLNAYHNFELIFLATFVIHIFVFAMSPGRKSTSGA